MSFLFEEVDVIEEEVEPSYDPSLSQESVQIPKMAIIDLQADKPKVEEVPLVAQKAFVFNDNVQTKRELNKPAPPKTAVVSKIYQPQGIISPIFGKKEQISPVTRVSQTPLPLQGENESIIGTVFSPIYGSVAPHNKAKKHQHTANKHVSMEELFSDDVGNHPTFEQPQLDALFEQERKENLSADFATQPELQPESSDRLVFCSLFDEQE